MLLIFVQNNCPPSFTMYQRGKNANSQLTVRRRSCDHQQEVTLINEMKTSSPIITSVNNGCFSLC